MSKVPAHVRSSSVEYRATFAEPLIGRWPETGRIAQRLFAAFRDWDLTLDQVSETPFAQSLAQHAWLFQLRGRYNFRLTMAGVSLTIANPFWDEAREVAKIVARGLDAVCSSEDVQLLKHDATIDIHLECSASARELMNRFSVPNNAVPKSKLTGAGFILHSEKGLLHADMSAYFPNAIFLRIARTFGVGTELADMFAQLLQDERDLLDIIGLEIAGLTTEVEGR